ncbi:hypothetical protein BDD43_3257 [Mucilaginibacter gracilis]|uniref:Uncharacterized protein n=1 Tax=Mucilaginibacter gracilis TaxID=423350 RepID=A0A495J288_9SPHI|nr:hypothetical protein [Mucilaginibacter gracilis]RKR83057.1 hypothetical protein BDD43_3257 [Mucilaginibacter gracilis]
MKKILLILLLSITAFTVKAQNMTFDETVKYINDKIDTSRWSKITVTRNGTVTAGDKTVNLFDLPETHIAFYSQYDKGIAIWFNHPYYVSLALDSSIGRITIGGFSVEKDAERVYNALVYLRSLCTKSKDPFDK